MPQRKYVPGKWTGPSPSLGLVDIMPGETFLAATAVSMMWPSPLPTSGKSLGFNALPSLTLTRTMAMGRETFSKRTLTSFTSASAA